MGVKEPLGISERLSPFVQPIGTTQSVFWNDPARMTVESNELGVCSSAEKLMTQKLPVGTE